MVEELSKELLELPPPLLHRLLVPVAEALLGWEMKLLCERVSLPHLFPEFVYLRVALEDCPFRIAHSDENLHIKKPVENSKNGWI